MDTGTAKSHDLDKTTKPQGTFSLRNIKYIKREENTSLGKEVQKL